MQISVLGDFMIDNRRKKMYVASVAALLLLSSVIFLAGVKANPDDDLAVSLAYEPEGTPPPRVNQDYDYVVHWENNGASDYDATVRIYNSYLDVNDDCQISSLSSESESINMVGGENGQVVLSITFSEEGDNCFIATIYYSGEDHGSLVTNPVFVEPEIGDAELYASLDLNSNRYDPGEDALVTIEYGNNGNVSTKTPITLRFWFGPEDDTELYEISPSPIHFSYVSPDQEGFNENMPLEYQIPEGLSDGVHVFTVKIDTDSNNTEDSVLDNNEFSSEVCIGDCSRPDLKVKLQEEFTLTVDPIAPVAGTIISFLYSIENIGDGDAEPVGGDFVMFLEVMKCPEQDCSGEDWVKVNESLPIIMGIPPGQEFSDEQFLRLNWSTSPQDSGFWNVRVVVDGNDVVDESDESNNVEEDATWFKVKGGYLNLDEQRPDLIITGIFEGEDEVYQDEEITLSIAVAQTEQGEVFANNVKVSLTIEDPQGDTVDINIDKTDTVGLNGEVATFEYLWTPTKIGYYAIHAYVDKSDEILEWDEDNNAFENKVIEVVKRLPDLQIDSLTFSPVNEEGYSKVGINSELIAVITNHGVRNMTETEGQMLEIDFTTVSPFTSNLGTINVNHALAVGESVEVRIDFIFEENAAYRIIATVDNQDLIPEGRYELNNQATLNTYSVSAIDAYVSNMSVNTGDGLAGKPCPVYFDVGMSDIPEGRTYRVYFNVSIDGTFDFNKYSLPLATQNMSGSYPIGTGYSVIGKYAFIDFNSSFNKQTVMIPWIPDAERTDTYNVSVEISSKINVNDENDIVYVNKLDIQKLTTNLRVDGITVVEPSEGSVTIKVTVEYPDGEQDQINVPVALHVYKSSDYTAGNPPVDTLTVKTIDGLLKEDSRSVSFTWATKDGSYIFVAIIDPEDVIKEVNEKDNIVPSKEQVFGQQTSTVEDEEEDEGLLSSLSLLVVISLFGLIASVRRRI